MLLHLGKDSTSVTISPNLNHKKRSKSPKDCNCQRDHYKKSTHSRKMEYLERSHKILETDYYDSYESDYFSGLSFSEHDMDEGFYETPARTILPSEDIWRKFDLLPTPPHSPTRSPSPTLGQLDGHIEKMCLIPNPDNCVSILDCDSNHSDQLIKDCMWPVKSVDKITNFSSSTMERSQKLTHVYSSVDISTGPDCVDPTSVFPYPVTEVQDLHHSMGTETPSDSEEEIDVVSLEQTSTPPITPPITLTLSKTMYESRTLLVKRLIEDEPKPSPAVTQARINQHLMQDHQAYSKQATDEYYSPMSSPRRQTTIHVNVHSPTALRYNLKRTRQESPPRIHRRHDHSARKKLKREFRMSDLNTVVQKLKNRTSSVMSDYDLGECPAGRRTQHNVLERKRRDDLKSSFLFLRDNVPALAGSQRAPKVLILRAAAEYIHELNNNDVLLASELSSLKIQREKLKANLRHLRALFQED